MKVERFWETEVDCYPPTIYRNHMELRERVFIDLTKDKTVLPCVTQCTEDSFSIHNLVVWGSMLLTRAQAKELLKDLQAALSL